MYMWCVGCWSSDLPVIANSNSITACRDANVSTECWEFKCDGGYYLNRSIPSCTIDAKWSYAADTCIRMYFAFFFIFYFFVLPTTFLVSFNFTIRDSGGLMIIWSAPFFCNTKRMMEESFLHPHPHPHTTTTPHTPHTHTHMQVWGFLVSSKKIIRNAGKTKSTKRMTRGWYTMYGDIDAIVFELNNDSWWKMILFLNWERQLVVTVIQIHVYVDICVYVCVCTSKPVVPCGTTTTTKNNNNNNNKTTAKKWISYSTGLKKKEKKQQQKQQQQQQKNNNKKITTKKTTAKKWISYSTGLKKKKQQQQQKQQQQKHTHKKQKTKKKTKHEVSFKFRTF